MKQVKHHNVFIHYTNYKSSSVTLIIRYHLKNWFEGFFSSLVLSMNKTFYKSYIITPIELILNYFELNYSLLDTNCFTYTEANFIRVTSWLQTSLHNRTTIMKKCDNIHCERKTLWTWPIWQNCYQETTIEEAKRCQKTPEV